MRTKHPSIIAALLILSLALASYSPVEAAGPITATGGIVTTSGNKTVHTFTSGGTFSITGGQGYVEVLIVGGGGGGGGQPGGNAYPGTGGGGGGVRYIAAYRVVAGQSVSITVGSGGSGAVGGTNGQAGGQSAFGSFTAGGGGYGTYNAAGGSGASGGGGGVSGNAGGSANGDGSGNAGGAGGSPPAGCVQGGGGGAGAAGQASGCSSPSGNGGNGLSYSISGAATYYAGGGGSGVEDVGTFSGAGGLGGGGAGGLGSPLQNGTNGTANTGGGGGGGGADNSATATNGGNGGSGVVIVSYSTRGTVFLSTQVTASSDANVVGVLSKGSGTFVIDDPIDPLNKLLFHSFVESPDVKNIYDGVATLDQSGEATIELPDYFEALNKDFRYLATPIGTPMPDLHLSHEVTKRYFGLFGATVFRLAGGAPGGQVSWQVTGDRHDPYILAHPIIPEVEKGSGQLVGKGQYLHPELYAQ